MEKKLKKIIKYKGIIKTLSGLSIQGTNSDLNIGGVNSEVIKNPLTNEPYIPGSSLKGKIRSLLELKYGMKDKRGNVQTKEPCGCGYEDCMICKIFGAHKNSASKVAPTRIIIRDCYLTEDSKEDIKNIPFERGNYLEEKAENIINRENGKAEHPRLIERIPAGLHFDFEINLQIFDCDDEEEMKKFIEEGIDLLESTYLGGSGSRGFGQVKFEKCKWENCNNV